MLPIKKDKLLLDEFECICTRVCDCLDPEPKLGIAHVSNECPIHNDYPKPLAECPAHVHWWQEHYQEGSQLRQLELDLT